MSRIRIQKAQKRMDPDPQHCFLAHRSGSGSSSFYAAIDPDQVHSKQC